MDDDEIDRFLEQAIPDDATEEAKERFRDLRKNPPDEGNAAETTIEDLDIEVPQSLFYKLNRASASGLDPEGEARRKINQTTFRTVEYSQRLQKTD